MLEVPRTTLQAWRASADSLDACPAIAAFLQSVPSLAFLYRLVLAVHLAYVEMSACGIRLVCRLRYTPTAQASCSLVMTGLAACECKELLWEIDRKCIEILAEIKYRKSHAIFLRCLLWYV